VTDSENANGGSGLWTEALIDRRGVSDELSVVLAKSVNHPNSRTHYFLQAAKRRPRCGSVRGMPVLSSHFSPGLAPHVEQRTIRGCSFFAFIATSCSVPQAQQRNMVNSDQPTTSLLC
jgi:hypothetical protein